MSAMPNIIPISDLRQDTAGVIKRAAASDEPVFITQRGRASAVLVSSNAYQRTQRELEILHLLARGEAEIAAGVGYDLDEVMEEARLLLARDSA
ncbi:MAG: type II toxin-antitoxin system Phd/YefM family antitoxin [Actinomycetota bacterium]|nr:type II toxin-antitoxin system Phd/YefM family antitoxin [Caldisericota bacterium]MDP3630251.1 type II toxin-antitoxin system Phd/YefM family antitoxin [Actinomycetota bacterium]